jgi:Phosphopantothenate-cysteine ligase (EC 6.3.2.5)/Phosphopantothenoylcysteine decarboxylase (EC 4.1.1.36)
MIKGKTITLGVTGGIAAYKAAELASLLSKAGADVHVIMTASAQKFVAPATFAALTRNPVQTDLFAGTDGPGGGGGSAAAPHRTGEGGFVGSSSGYR